MTNVGDAISAANARWSFGGEVADHFDQHVERSVPLYREGHGLVAELSDFFLYDGALMYELGCSTGELIRRVAERNQGRQVRLLGIDVEASMVQAAQRKCADFANVKITQADLIELELAPADLVVAYYTMQFVRPRFRQQVFDRIFAALNWGGAFLLFEKVRAPDARFQDVMTALYTDFKLRQGFDEAEVVNKTRSLKGVLEPFSTQGNLDLLKRAGFQDIMTVMKYACFEGFLAIK